jgi:enoyl-CoA hydratase/carnithine racemase
MDILLEGDTLTAQDALQIGLVQSVVSPTNLLEAALEKAATIASNSQAAVWGTKQVVRFWSDALLSEQHSYYKAVAHAVDMAGDIHEGPRAFVQKRRPTYKNEWPLLSDDK